MIKKFDTYSYNSNSFFTRVFIKFCWNLLFLHEIGLGSFRNCIRMEILFNISVNTKF